MTETTSRSDSSGSVRTDRRSVLRTIGGCGLASVSIAGLSTPAAAQEPGEAEWTFETGGAVYASPTIMDATVYIGSGDGNLYALDAETGEEQWSFEAAGDGVRSSAYVVDGLVYVGAENANVYALDAETGEEQWVYETVADPVRSSPTVVDGTVYVGGSYKKEGGTEDHNVYALDAETGEEQWQFEAGYYVSAAPAVALDTVLIGAGNKKMYGLDAETGEQQWVYDTIGRVSSAATTVGDWVFFSTEGSHITALDIETGEEQWDSEVYVEETACCMNIYPTYEPTWADGSLYAAGDPGEIYRVDPATGDREAIFGVESGNFRSAPTVADGTVFVGNDNSTLYAVDAETGEQEWAYETDYWVRSSPTVVDGTVYVGSLDGNVYALNAGVDGSSSGSRVLQRTLGHRDEYSDHTDRSIGGANGEGSEMDTSTSGAETNEETDGEGTGGDSTTSVPGFGIGETVAAIGGAGYLLKRRLDRER